MDKFYKHIKSGRIYEVIFLDVINATNKDDGKQMVLYKGEQRHLKKDGSGFVRLFVREIDEFLEKFELI